MAIGDGVKIAIRFTEPLIGDVTGLTPIPVGYRYQKISFSGAVVTALNQYSSSYPPSKAIDGSTSTYWYGTTAVNWICVQLAAAKVVTQVRMYLSSYYIKTFTVSGSNDGETFTQLGGEYTAASSTTGKWYEIPIQNNTAYRYYRINTLTTYSSSIYLYELEFCESVPVGNETAFTVSFQEYDYVPGGSLKDVQRTVKSVSGYNTIDTAPSADSAVLSDTEAVNGVIELAEEEDETDGEL